MNTRFILVGISAAILSLTALESGAQTAAPETPVPADNGAKASAPAKPSSALMEKLKAAAANLSPPVLEIVRMSDAGADSAVIQAFVETSPIAYSPKADEIIYLHEHNISTTIITAMIQHGAKLREEGAAAQAAAANQVPPFQPASPAPSAYPVQQADPASVAASPVEVYPEPAYYPGYAYAYPRYYAPYASFGFYLPEPFYGGRFHYGHSFGGRFGHSFGGGAHFSGRSGSGSFSHR